ncbi:PKD domain-containing protein [Paenibacillus lycopersici]|uniref:PKD domain-containing protein n=1 Tax=Paenibacillus lycopersici TaxID=2704462 RepID=A0A6C0FVQ3_9BACL|nr:PKD domain-containing protein [Paenibacillus lycopersici]QHT59374.1 PKD domain-containing protein [Paenibacillus lycopersici]
MRYLSKKRLVVYLIINLLAFVVPNFPGTVKVAHADSPAWSEVGQPSPGSVNSLLNVDDMLYAGGDTGIWSYNSDTWMKMSGSPDYSSVRALENVDGTLYAGVYGTGIYSYSNGTWTWVNGSPYSVTALENINGTLYAATHFSGVWSYSNGVLTQMSGSPEYVTTLLNVDGTLYAGTYYTGIWSYSNGAWTQMSGSPVDVVSLLHVDGELYAGTEGLGIWSYGNGTWLRMDGSPEYGNITALENVNGTLYAGANGIGVWAYSNGIWTQMSGSPELVDSLLNVNGTLYAGGYDGVMQLTAYYSSVPANLKAGSTTSESTTLTWDAVPGAIAYNIYKNGDHAAIATVTSPAYIVNGLTPNTAYTFTVSAINGTESARSGAINVVTMPNNPTGPTDPNGPTDPADPADPLTWSQVGVSPPNVTSLLNVDGTLYAGTTKYVWSYGNGQWTRMDGSPRYVYALLNVNGTLYAGTLDGSNDIWSYSDGTWTPMNSPRYVYALVNVDGTLYAGTMSGVWSYSNGSAWTLINDSPSSIQTLLNVNGTLYAGAFYDSSNDVWSYGNGTWTQMDGSPYGITNLLNDNDTLYAGTYNGGVWSYSNGTWTQMDGSPSHVNSLLNDNGTLYAGATNGANDVWSYSNGKWTQMNGSPSRVYSLLNVNGTLYAGGDFGVEQLSHTSSTPINLEASGTTSESTTLTWDAVPGATAYNIYKNESAAAIATVTSPAYTVNGLASNTMYTFTVVARNEMESDQRGKLNVLTTPNSPTRLVVTEGDKQVVLAWGRVSGTGTVTYSIYEGTSPGSYSTNPIATVTDSTFTATGLVNGTRYYYAVKASNAGGSSGYSEEVDVTPQSKFSVIYHGNRAMSGDVPIDNSLYTSGDTVRVYDNIGKLAQPGYIFAGWNTTADGSGTSFAPGATLTMGEANLTLYAQYTMDNEAPKVISISPSESSILPANPVINVLASDNYKLSKVTIEYQKVGAPADQWNELGTKDLNASSDVVSLVWNTSSSISGTYKLRTVVYDQAGNASTPKDVLYRLDVDPPATPIVTASPGGWKIDLSWTSGNETDLAGFRIFKSLTPEGPFNFVTETKLTSYTDVPLAPGSNYYYKVEAADRYGNASMSEETSASPLSQDPFAPKAKAGNNQNATVGMEVAFDGKRSSDNDRIAAYSWDFGDGTTSDLAQPTHSYNSAGSYTVALTVTDPAGNAASDTMIVTVYPEQQETLQVKVIDGDTGAVIPGANVYVNFSDHAAKDYMTDGNGTAAIVAVPGKYEVSAYKTGYLPAEVTSEVNQHQETQVTVSIKKGKLVVGEPNVHRMSLEEIVAAGIDANAPENQHVFKFEVRLTFAQQPLPVEYLILNGHGDILSGGGPIAYGDGGVGSGSFARYAYPKAIVYANHPEIPPTLAFLTVPKEVSWQKEFFEVGLSLQNMADPQFVIANATAALKLPEGLTLAPAAEEQSPIIRIGDIAGQETKEVNWIVRGDREGSYDLEADFNGTLMPFSAPVNTTFKTSEPFRVWGGSALHIYVEAEDSAYLGEQYYVQFRIKNESDAPIYNLKTNFGAYSEPTPVHEVVIIGPNGSKTKERYEAGASFYMSSIDAGKSLPILQTGDSVGIGVLNPGESLSGTYVTNFSAAGDRDEVYYRLKDAFSVTSGGSTTEVPVTISTVPSHITKYKEVIDDGSMWADPVDTTTGADVIERRDLSVMGAGSHEFSFDLRYNSLLLNDGSMGKGWSHNYETRLEPKEDGTILVYWSPSNYTKFFSKDFIDGQVYGSKGADGTVLLSNADHGSSEQEYDSKTSGMTEYALKKKSDGTYSLAYGNKNAYFFDESGKLTGIQDKDGHNITLTSSEGKLVIAEAITDQTLTVSYNAQGQVERVSDKMGRTVSFRYDANAFLTAITDVNGNTTTYTYDSAGHVLTGTDGEGVTFFANTYDDKGRVLTQDDGVAGNQLTRFSYDDTSDSWGEIVTITERNGETRKHASDRFGQLSWIQDELGNKTAYAYDSRGNRISETDAKGNTSHYTYDSHGNLITITDPAGHAETMAYDDQDHLISIANAAGEKIINTYDSHGHLTSTTDAMGNTTNYTYDDNGFVVSKTSPGKGRTVFNYENGLLHSVTDPTHKQTTYTYDQAGRVISISDEEGIVTAIAYSNMSQILRLTDAMGNTISYTYDSRGHKLTETDASGNMTKFRYNGNGDLISQTDALNHTTHYSYEGEGRLTEIMDSLGNTTRMIYDAKGQLTGITDPSGNTSQIQYDSVGNAIGNTDALGQTTSSRSYDAVGNLLSEVDALGNATTYRYDSLNRLVDATDPLGRSTRYQYDDNNRLAQVVDALQGLSSQGFDRDGNRTSLTDPNHNKTTFDFDAAGRLTGVNSDSGNAITYEYNARGLISKSTNGRGQETDYTYDDSGRLLNFTDPVGTVSYTYDSNGNVRSAQDALGTISWEYDAMNQVTRYEDAYGNTIQYSYDDAGNLKTLTYPDGKTVSYDYDSAYRLIQVTDWSGRKTRYGYDANGRLAMTSRPDGSIERRIYDKAGQLAEIKDVASDGTVITDDQYSYDSVGDVQQESRTSAMGEQSIPASRVMTYTKGNRLATVDGNEIAYDADGNMLTGPLGGKMVSYHYDARNRLINVNRIADGSDSTSAYQYDALNNRVGMMLNGQASRYVINPQASLTQLLMVTDDRGVPQTNYVYGIGLIGQEDSQGDYLTYHFDRRGSTVGLTDEQGKVIDRFEYSLFGEIIEHEGNRSTPFLYSGRDGVMTDSNGLYYMRARYYNPEIRRFINEDTLLGSIANSQELNRYAYAQGNPVSHIDPGGHWVGYDDAVAAGVGAATGLTGQYISDVVANLSNGKTGLSAFAPTSGWNAYTGSAVGGAITGVSALYGPVGIAVGNVVGSAAGSAINQIGDRWSWKEFAADTAVGSLIGSIHAPVKAVKIQGVNAGRGNWGSSFDGLVTKVKKGSVTNIRTETMVHAGISKYVDDLAETGKSGVFNGFWQYQKDRSALFGGTNANYN